MKSRKTKLAMAVLAALVVMGRVCPAGTVATDGSLGHATNLTGPNFAVTSALGKQVGPNLFQSFSTFNLDKGETATFSGPANVGNVIARVTGGTSSAIDGTIQCTIPSAHFYLINPSGILFGPDATLDVKGSFVVTTADYLKFADGSHFNATHLSDTTLTSAAPAAFGFLAGNPAAIAINGSTLEVSQGQTVTLVGGGVQIVNGVIAAPAGRVNVVSVAGSGEVTFDPISLTADIDLAAGGPALGDVSMNASTISVAGPGTSGPGGGRVSVRAGSVEMINTDIFATDAGASEGLGVDIVVTGTFTLSPGVIATDSSGAGQAGPVSIAASAITIDGTGQAALATGISATAYATGQGGNITLNTGSLSIVGGSTLFAGSFAAGNGGTVAINATGDVHVDGTSTILTPAFATGNAGNINIAAGSFELTNGGRIAASTNSTGNAGNIMINAGSIAIDNVGGTGSGIGIVSASNSSGTGGNAGQIVINTPSLSVTQGAVISASTFGSGAAGSVTITGGSVTLDEGTSSALTGIFAGSFNATGGAAGTISISGTHMQVLNGAAVDVGISGAAAGGTININVADLTLDNRGSSATLLGTTGLLAVTNSGTGGQITVVANTVSILGGAEIDVDSSGGGNAGNISLTASQSLTLDGRASGIFTGLSADAITGAGNAGNIHVTDGTLSVIGGAEIVAGTFGSGGAGTINIASTQSFTLDDQSMHLGTGVLADTMDGPGGSVQITGGTFAIMGGAQVSAGSFGAGPAGTVTINVTNMTGQGVTGAGSLVSAGAFGTGPAGTVNVTANSLTLTGTASITSETAGPAPAGAVNITADSLTQNGSGGTGTIDAATLSSGNAGVVNINAGTMQVLNGSIVNASTSGSGQGGIVNVTASVLTLDRAGSSVNTGILSESIVPSTGPIPSPGSAGTINVHAGWLVINNDAVIDTTTFGAGAAGGINVNASSLFLENGGSITSNTQGAGKAGSIIINAGSLQILNSSQITSDTLSGAPGGSVAVNVTGSLTIDGQGFTGPSATGITAATNGMGGNAGSVSVQAGSLIIRNHGTIESDSEGGTGSAGNVVVSANSINVQSEGTISSGTFGSGNGGDVTVTGKQILVNGEGAKAFTGITAQTNGSGHAGTVRVSGSFLQLINGGEIGSSSFAAGAGGSVFIDATDLTLKNNSVVDSASTLSGPAGTVNIHLSDALSLYRSEITSQSLKVSGGGVTIFARDSIQLRGSKITTQAAGEGGKIDIQCLGFIDLINSQGLTKAGDNGGNLTIDPSFVVLENSNLSANGGINGGNISVKPNFLLTSQSSITATGAKGVSGMLQITPDYNLTGAILSLPATLSDSLTLEPQCAADLAGNISSFIVTGRGGEPLTPGGFVPALDLRIPAPSKLKE